MRLIAPQFVKPYVNSSKDDVADAEAICEALLRSNMRFVAVKTTRSAGAVGATPCPPGIK